MKRHKKRLRRYKAVHQFCVIAEDSASVESILQAAKSHDLRVFTKGHSAHRLYFECSQKAWDHFRPQIQDYVLDGSVVQCPTWVQKKIRTNLQATATNGFFPRLAKRASEILATANAKARLKNEEPEKAPKTEASSGTMRGSQSAPAARKGTLRNCVSRLIHKLRDIPRLIKFNKSRRPVRG